MKLNRDYYQHDDVVAIARDLIGKTLCTYISGQLCKGVIVETEAYNGRIDKASHSFGGLRSKRTEVMYGPPGISYVYLCYGIHNMFNVVTNEEGLADAVLIRGLKPHEGIEFMMGRRGFQNNHKRLSSGPGTLSTAMGIDRSHYGEDLCGATIWVEDYGITPNIEVTKRVGIEYAGSDSLLPWRFISKES